MIKSIQQQDAEWKAAEQTALRAQALDLALQDRGVLDSAEDVVARAKVFYAWLAGENDVTEVQ